MATFRVAFTGDIAGMGADHVKHTILHRFEGGNGTAEIYPTEDRNEIAILSQDRHCEIVADGVEEVVDEAAPPAPEVVETEKKGLVDRVRDLVVRKDNGHEEPQKAVRKEAETPAVSQEAEKPAVAPAEYTREEWVAVLGKKNHNTELKPMADQMGVGTVAAGGGFIKKDVLVEKLADAYMAGQDGE